MDSYLKQSLSTRNGRLSHDVTVVVNRGINTGISQA